MSAEPEHAVKKPKVNLKYVPPPSLLKSEETNTINSDASGAEKREELDTSTAILRVSSARKPANDHKPQFLIEMIACHTSLG